jgi:predicted TIM-barrel fold metal-dependent hydrolase
VRIVDAQCHVATIWYEPVEILLAQMDRNDVAQAVLIQRLGEFDNDYQQACAARHPERFASVVAVDPTAPDACDELAALAEHGAAGVRLRPEARSPAGDPLAIWRAAAVLRLPVSCVGSAETFGAADFFELIATLPELTIVLEHLGGTSQAGATDLPARRRVFEAAQFPNVYLKLPGLGELLPRSSLLSAHEPAPPIPELELALECFGQERLMWGSDFPLIGSREGYANALEWTRRAVADAMPGAEEDVFGGTASRVFRLS